MTDQTSTASPSRSSLRALLPLVPYAWRYREYVIDAFNADKPYNRFVQEKLAGDQLPRIC